ncbi:hypothetical protein AUR04nite_21680 [Glutamicibacter uratoxydans]|uniref:Uncharacterized protein n=1 Tax=Glutamicibacter uratoxydans TaxID=43667 RepID=A0A4Y4DNY7_GLUUR|nr:hypothetical protein [Glutamicibacter uratoxydans]GED06636.1 hypothetical protein AUR04nite_21680 [Glutamicibacter uratoxydans]
MENRSTFLSCKAKALCLRGPAIARVLEQQGAYLGLCYWDSRQPVLARHKQKPPGQINHVGKLMNEEA